MSIGSKWAVRWAPSIMVCAFCAAFPLAMWWVTGREYSPQENVVPDNAHDVLELINTAFTVVLSLSTIALWCATRRLAAGADETAKRELRAYIHVSEALFKWNDEKGGWIAEFSYLNSGKTPAHNVRIRAGILAKNTGDPEPEWVCADDYQIGVMGPNGDDFWDHQQFNDEFLVRDKSLKAALQDGTKEVYLFGRIDYQDVFDDTRWTTFRYFVGGEDGFWDESMTACRQGNEIEASCR